MTTTNMTPTTSPHGSRPPAPRRRVIPIGSTLAAVLAGGAAVLALSTGRGAEYSAIFPPVWLGLLGAGLLGLAVTLGTRSLGRLAQVTAWLACVVLLGASGGVLLDGFRAFFAVTGIPAGDFAEVDVPGAIARLSALVASFFAVQFARRIEVEAGSVRSTVSDSRRRIVGLVGALLCLPYPLLKLVWWMQGDGGSFTVGFPAMELALFACAVLVLVALTAQRTPAAARVPLLIAGWIGAFALLSMGSLMVFGTLAQAAGVAASPIAFGEPARIVLVTAVYSTWLLLGVALAAATVLYGESRPARSLRSRDDEASRGAQ